MALQVHEACFCSFGAELFVQICIGAGEGDVHGAAVAVLHRIREEVLTIQIVVQHLGLGFVDLLHVGKTADVVFQILEHQTGHIDAPAGGRVVHAVLAQQGGVVHHGGHIVGGMAQQVIADDGNGHTGGGHILLYAEVDAAILGHVHRLGEDHGAHVCHQRHTLHLRHLHELGAEDGVVLADVDVAGILIIVDGVHVRDVGEVFVLAGSNDVHLAELGGFLGGKVREVAGDKVICLAGGHEIQRDHGKLLGGTALKETDLVVVGNVHYPAQGGLGVLDDGIEPLAAVAHLHHALTAVAVLEQLCLCLLEHLLGQHAGACAEVVNSCHNELSLSCIAQHRVFLRCVLLIAVAVVYRFCRGENKSIFAQRYGAKAPAQAQSTQMSLMERQKQRQV